MCCVARSRGYDTRIAGEDPIEPPADLLLGIATRDELHQGPKDHTRHDGYGERKEYLSPERTPLQAPIHEKEELCATEADDVERKDQGVGARPKSGVVFVKVGA